MGGALFFPALAPLTPPTQGSLSQASTATLVGAENPWDLSGGCESNNTYKKGLQAP